MATDPTLRTFLTEVVAVEDVSAGLRRIVVEGGDLRDFAPVGPDTFLYLLAAPPGCPALPIDRAFSWEAYAQMGEDVRPVGAYYTVRTWDPERSRIELLVVRHGEHGEPGPAAAWTERARPGEAIGLWGPRTTYAPPPDTDELLVAVDETGLPAAAGIVEQLPAGWRATVVAEVADAGWEEVLPAVPGVEVVWLHRRGAPAGTTTLLVDAVRRLGPLRPTAYAWGGAESRSLTAVRRHVRHALGHPRERVSLVGYWRHASSPTEDPYDD